MEFSTDLPLHPYCLLVPEPSEADFQRIGADIGETRTINDPITVYEGQILDGRIRAHFAKLYGIHLPEAPFEGTDEEAVAYVRSQSLARRHMSASQLAILGAEIAKKLRQLRGEAEGEPSGKQAAVAASVVGASQSYVEIAERLEREAPDLYEAARAGRSNLSKAAKELKRRKAAAGDSKPKPQLSGDTDESKASKPDAPMVVDAEGGEIPELLLPVFAALGDFKRWRQDLLRIEREIEAMAMQPAGKYICLKSIKTDIANARVGLSNSKPHTVCEACNGDGCGKCKGVGFITKGHYLVLHPTSAAG